MKMFSFWIFLLFSIYMFLNPLALMGQLQGNGNGWLCVTGRPWETDAPRHNEPVLKNPGMGCVCTLTGSEDLSAGQIIRDLDRVNSFGTSTQSSEMFYWLKYELFELNIFCR